MPGSLKQPGWYDLGNQNLRKQVTLKIY